MKQSIKNFIKKSIPPRYIELITNKGIALTKIPKEEAVISDLFVLRVEEGWETYFEYLQFQSLLNTDENELAKSVHIVFYNQKGLSKKRRWGSSRFLCFQSIQGISINTCPPIFNFCVNDVKKSTGSVTCSRT